MDHKNLNLSENGSAQRTTVSWTRPDQNSKSTTPLHPYNFVGGTFLRRSTMNEAEKF